MKESWANEDILCLSDTPNNNSCSTVLRPDSAYLDDLKLPSLTRIGSDPLFKSCGLQDKLSRFAPSLAAKDLYKVATIYRSKPASLCLSGLHMHMHILRRAYLISRQHAATGLQRTDSGSGQCSLRELPTSSQAGGVELDASMRLWSWDDLATTKYFY